MFFNVKKFSNISKWNISSCISSYDTRSGNEGGLIPLIPSNKQGDASGANLQATNVSLKHLLISYNVTQ